MKPLLLTWTLNLFLWISPTQCSEWTEDQLRVLETISNQMKAQELYLAEKIRSEGHSGVKQVRYSRVGTRPYHTNTHGHRNVLSMHNHANNIRTVGLGELIAVMNGNEFRTRHNDYSLVMPSLTNKSFHAIEQIPFPDVPPEVLKYNTLEQQVEEMRLWFKAWADQDYSERDYRDYFKPVLCYLEGAWVYGESVDMDGFESDRHYIDASSWHELQEKVSFTSEAGRKDQNENFAYLPTKIVEVINGTPSLAQWNYRIMCHPLKKDLPLNRLRPVEDLANRMAYDLTWQEYVSSNGARFQINPDDDDIWSETTSQRGFLDELIEEIPGKDNYPADLIDDAMDAMAYEMEQDADGNNVVLNSGYYHRWFKVSKKGAGGLMNRIRGYSDDNLFMAMTSNPQVVPSKYEKCTGQGKSKECWMEEQRWTYAFPLEIVFLTPLSTWNYYNIKYHGEANTPEGKTVTDGGRNGQLEPEKAYNGVNSKTYYITPTEFFSGTEENKDAADTTKSSAGVLDPSGEMRVMRASGTRIFFPNIPGVGTLRQRYPIVPLHNEGSTIWKELSALTDVVMYPTLTGWALRDVKQPVLRHGITLQMEGNEDHDILHTHKIYISEPDLIDLQMGYELWINSETSDGHEHRIKVEYHLKPNGQGVYRYIEMIPYHQHPRMLTILDETGLEEDDYNYL